MHAATGLPVQGSCASASRNEVGVEIDPIAVGVSQLRIALTPERIPGLLMAVATRPQGPRVEFVDGCRAGATEGYAHTRRTIPSAPAGIEAPDNFLRVEQQPHTTLELGLGVAVLGLLGTFREWGPEKAVETHPASQITNDDAHRVELSLNHPH